MSERSHLSNGRFLHGLDSWTAGSATYSPSDGDEHYGIAVLSTGGGYIEQSFSVSRARGYSLHLAVKPSGSDLSAGQATLQLTDGDGNTVLTRGLTGTANTWTETTLTLGLVPGATYTMRLTNVSAASDIKIDDVWLWWVPKTRAQLATEVHAKLGRLASERSLSTTVNGSLTEGDYTYAVDAGLRIAGAIDPETDLPDVRWLAANDLDTALDIIERKMLERLQRDYAVEVDMQVGPRRESLSQITQAIEQLTGTGDQQGGGGGTRRVIVRKLSRETQDYELG